ncbi:MAG: VTC domain-containing protein [Propionibacteriaceae bacterium]|jgi:hypothetical protein|nr:VTC domain-containing protein [Propionibacteriaceae bacterium]
MTALAPVSLDELNSRAALLDRVDRKYVVPAERLPELLEWLPEGTAALEIAGRRQFAYQTCYHDTWDLLTYRLATQRRRRRFKVRTRTYADQSSWLEVKASAGRGRTVKERVEADGLLPWWVGQTLAAAGFTMAPQDWRPCLMAAFDRSTLLLPAACGVGPARVTVDANLRWSLPGGCWREADIAVVETKSPNAPTAFDHALWGLGLRPERFSKYATALAWLRPELPSNRWRRGLARHLAVAG